MNGRELSRRDEDFDSSNKQHKQECYEEFLNEPNWSGIKAWKKCVCEDGIILHDSPMDSSSWCKKCNGKSYTSRTLTVKEVLELAPKMIKDIDNLDRHQLEPDIYFPESLTLPNGEKVYVEGE